MAYSTFRQFQPVPAYLLPPAQHWARQARANASAQEHPYSHPDRAPGADIAQKDDLVFGPGLVPTRSYAEDEGKGKGKAVCHARIDSVASDASATTVASASSSMSRASSSASSASLTDSDAEDDWHNGHQRHVETSNAIGDESPRLPLFTIPSYAGSSKDAALPVARATSEHRLRRMLPSTIRCRRCAVDFAFTSQILSKGFTARDGRGYLVSPLPSNTDHTLAPEHDPESYNIGSDEAEYIREGMRLFDESGRHWDNNVYQARRRRNNLPNVDVGGLQQRSLTTGRHIIADIVCRGCSDDIGWKYIDARELDQLYKVGNFILEANKVTIHRSWENVDDATVGAIGPRGNTERQSLCYSSTSSSSSSPSSSSSFWASRTAGAISLADADPLGSVRAINAHLFQRLKYLQTTTKRDRNSDYYDKPDSDHPAVSHGTETMHRVFESHVAELERNYPGASRRRWNTTWSTLTEAPPIVYSSYDDDDDDDNDNVITGPFRKRCIVTAPPEIEFDSQDEDECEQLFAGTWDARTVVKQRRLAEAARAKKAAAGVDGVAAQNAAADTTSEHIER